MVFRSPLSGAGASACAGASAGLSLRRAQPNSPFFSALLLSWVSVSCGLSLEPNMKCHYLSSAAHVRLIESGRDRPLLAHPPLRTVRASFLAYGSSL